VDALVGRFGKGWLGVVESLARVFKEKCRHRDRVKATHAAPRDREILQIRNSLFGMLTAEVTERTPLPPGCSVTWPAGRFSTRRSFVPSRLAK
jgi:hypothetical protein